MVLMVQLLKLLLYASILVDLTNQQESGDEGPTKSLQTSSSKTGFFKVPKLTIGFVYCDEADLFKAFEHVNKLNANENLTYLSKVRYKLELKGLQLKSDDNPVTLSLSVCQNLMFKEPIYAVVIASTSCLQKNYNRSATTKIRTSEASNEVGSRLEKLMPITFSQDESDFLLSMSSISFTCAYYQIPVIDIKNRESIFSDKSIHSSLVRMMPPYFHQASIWVDLIKEFDWRVVNLIHTNDHEGKMLATRFQYLADQYEVKVYFFFALFFYIILI